MLNDAMKALYRWCAERKLQSESDFLNEAFRFSAGQYLARLDTFLPMCLRIEIMFGLQLIPVANCFESYPYFFITAGQSRRDAWKQHFYQ